MSLVLSNAFKGLLLSSYVNTRFDVAVKSMKEIIDKPSVGFIHDGYFQTIDPNEDTFETSQLRKRIPKNSSITSMKTLTNPKQISGLQYGQSVILCHSINCPFFIMINPHLKLVYTDIHYFNRFESLKVKKSHSHSKQINKL